MARRIPGLMTVIAGTDTADGPATAGEADPARAAFGDAFSADGPVRWLATAGLGEGSGPPTQVDLDDEAARGKPLLERGTLVCEFTHDPRRLGRHALIDRQSASGPVRRLAVVVDPGGGVFLLHQQGHDRLAARLDLPGGGAGGDWRLVFNWDAPARHWTFSAESRRDGQRLTVAGADAVPLPIVEAQALFSEFKMEAPSPLLRWLALGDRPLSVVAATGVDAGARVLTPDGYRPAGALVPGDLVETLDRGPQPVLACGRLALPAMGGFRPVRLRANYLGARDDLRLPPAQLVALGGAEVEYLFGEDEVLIEAQALVDGRSVLIDEAGGTAGYAALLLERPELIRAEGCLVQSHWMREQGAWPPDLLADVPTPTSTRLPGHEAAARRILREYEALTFVAARSQAGRGVVI